MKLLIVVIAFCMFSTLSFSQTSDQYGMIYKLYDQKGKIKVLLDDGDGKPNVIQDELTGDPVLFDSMIHALNYMIGLGWQLVSFSSTIDSNNVVEHYYLLKK